jgi:hypothetical protein
MACSEKETGSIFGGYLKLIQERGLIICPDYMHCGIHSVDNDFTEMSNILVT